MKNEYQWRLALDEQKQAKAERAMSALKRGRRLVMNAASLRDTRKASALVKLHEARRSVQSAARLVEELWQQVRGSDTDTGETT